MEFKESYFITSDGARIFYRYRLSADVACENPGANEVNLSAGAANETSNLTDEQTGGIDENAEPGLAARVNLRSKIYQTAAKTRTQI